MKKYEIFDIYENDKNKYFAFSQEQAIQLVKELNSKEKDFKAYYVFVLRKDY